MGDVLAFPRHRFHSCDHPYCYVCKGGLRLCVDCGGVESSLTSDCPKVKIDGDQHLMISTGFIDFHVDKGWVWQDEMTGFGG